MKYLKSALDRGMLDKIDDSSVAGRIHHPQFRQLWLKDLKVGKFIQEFLERGYTIPLSEFPPKSELPNNLNARLDKNRAFVKKTLEHDLASGIIKNL
jgi:hypothetical protein